jgi:hypothetical protein
MAASANQVVFPTEKKLGVYIFEGDAVTIPGGFVTTWITPKP